MLILEFMPVTSIDKFCLRRVSKKSRAIYRFLTEVGHIIANILHDGRFFSIHVSAHFNKSEEILRHFVAGC